MEVGYFEPNHLDTIQHLMTTDANSLVVVPNPAEVIDVYGYVFGWKIRPLVTGSSLDLQVWRPSVSYVSGDSSYSYTLVGHTTITTTTAGYHTLTVGTCMNNITIE